MTSESSELTAWHTPSRSAAWKPILMRQLAVDASSPPSSPKKDQSVKYEEPPVSFNQHKGTIVYKLLLYNFSLMKLHDNNCHWESCINKK